MNMGFELVVRCFPALGVGWMLFAGRGLRLRGGCSMVSGAEAYTTIKDGESILIGVFLCMKGVGHAPARKKTRQPYALGF